MIRKKLRSKILLGALVLVLVVSMAITTVVSFLVTRQNAAAVHHSLDRTLTIVRDAVSSTRSVFTEAVRHMAIAAKLGQDAKFLDEFKDNDLSLTGNSFSKIVKAVTDEGVKDELFRVRVFRKDGTLVGFFEKTGPRTRVAGFLHRDTFHFGTFEKGEAYDGLKMTQGQGVRGADIPKSWDGPPPESDISGFRISGGHVSIYVLVPVYANVYNPETEKSEPRPFGFVEAVKQLDQGFVARMGRIIDMEMNLFAGSKLTAGDLALYATLDTGQVPDRTEPGWDIGKQGFIFNEIPLDKMQYFQGLLPLYENGDAVATLAVLKSDETVRANTRQMVMMISLVALGCVVLVIPLAWVASARVVNPLIRIVDKLKDIAQGDGDLTTRLEVSSKDEIGQVAQWFNTFIDKIHSLIKEVDDNAGKLNASSSTLAGISQTMAQGANQTYGSSESVSAASEEMSSAMTSVAAAMDQASANMASVAAATEQMTNTITEISRNTVSAREITDTVVEKTGQASAQVGALGESAAQIGQVVEAIADISDQVNLLALNATIEAARAGEAGKGFAVVANEIKDLAGQTAEASQDIAQKVDNIRTSTTQTMDQIDQVSKVVNQVNEIVVMIAGAVEEQSATTRNITKNIAQVSRGVEEVSENVAQSSSVSGEIASDIAKVSEAAKEMTQNSARVDTRSGDLSRLSEKLAAIVKRFKI